MNGDLLAAPFRLLLQFAKRVMNRLQIDENIKNIKLKYMGRIGQEVLVYNQLNDCSHLC